MPMTIAETTAPAIPTVPDFVLPDNRGIYERIRPRRTYNVSMPDGRTRRMTGTHVMKLPHWKHCTVELHDYYAPQLLRFRFSVFNVKEEGRFIYGGAKDVLDQYRLKATEVRTQQLVVARQQGRLQAAQAAASVAKEAFISGVKNRKSADDTRYTFERIREQLMANEHIIDVRLPGDLAPDYRLLLSNYRYERTPIAKCCLLVTFIGGVIYDPNVGEGDVVAIPTPPITMMFHDSGAVSGYGVCFHPHMSAGGGCMGEAQEMLYVAAGMGDIYAAIDIMQEYRIGHSSTERGRGNWESRAWDFWCRNEAIGWPDEEPYQKPWVKAGRPVYVGIKGQMMPVYEWLDVADRDEAMQAFHLGRSVLWYDPVSMKSQLASAKVYERRPFDADGKSVMFCPCGREAIGTDETSSCMCHPSTTNPPVCPGCNSGIGGCRCVADLRLWQLFGGGRVTYCDHCGVRKGSTDTSITMYTLKFQLDASLFNLSLRHLCEVCLGELGEVHE